MDQPRAESLEIEAVPRKGRLGILVVGDESVASTRYRILAHLPALNAAGYASSVAFQSSRSAHRLLRLPWRMIDEIRDLGRFSGYDLLLIHRRCYPPLIAKQLARRDKPTVFDFDDALYLPSPAEPQTANARRRYQRNFGATATAADLVLCGNAELLGAVENEQRVILPTAVDCDRFHPGAIGPVDRPTVGWVGHSSNLSYLEAIAGPLREVAARHPGFRLIVVADRKPRIEGVPMEFRPWSLDGEIECFRGIGIGLMPLADTPWTRAKCAFKLLQYMALGIPSVASPVGMNRDVVEPGENAMLAATQEEWVSVLGELIRKPDLRKRIGRAGRETVTRRYSLPVISQKLISSLDQIMINRC
jgi:glycosyltransferase involved in cell wall biosynthesis